MELLYERGEVEQILAAYKDIFPLIGAPLANYWGLGRERPWSYVTTDFHRTTYEQLKLLHDRTRVIDAMGLATKEKGAALRDASSECGVGFSMGICPWTDHLLLKTYSPEKDSLTILLGHDWYPIVVQSRTRSDSPLRNGDALHYTPKYMPAAPQAIFDGSTIGLFLTCIPTTDRRATENAGHCVTTASATKSVWMGWMRSSRLSAHAFRPYASFPGVLTSGAP